MGPKAGHFSLYFNASRGAVRLTTSVFAKGQKKARKGLNLENSEAERGRKFSFSCNGKICEIRSLSEDIEHLRLGNFEERAFELFFSRRRKSGIVVSGPN